MNWSSRGPSPPGTGPRDHAHSDRVKDLGRCSEARVLLDLYVKAGSEWGDDKRALDDRGFRRE